MDLLVVILIVALGALIYINYFDVFGVYSTTPTTPTANTPTTPTANTPTTPTANTPATPTANTPTTPTANTPITPSKETPATETPAMETPATLPTPIHGYYSNWSDWNKCSADCGGGMQSRERQYFNALHGGTEIPSSSRVLKENRTCNTHVCPSDGWYNAWSEWGPCSKTCGGGIRARTRAYMSAKGTGYEIPFDQRILREEQTCNTQTCDPVDKDAMCPEWAGYSPSECLTNPAYMLTMCAKSCAPYLNRPNIPLNNICHSNDAGKCQDQLKGKNGCVATLNGYAGSGDGIGVRNFSNKWPWEHLFSSDQRVPPYKTLMQKDGNLVVYNANNTPIWHSNTANRGTGPYYATVSDDCDFGVFDATHAKLWSSNTAGKTYWTPPLPPGEVCFDGDSIINLSNGEKKKIRDLRPGYEVQIFNGQTAMVNYIVKTDINNRPLCELNGMYITPYHPVFINDKWEFPINITKPKDNKCDAVYSIAVSSGHIVIINDIPVVTMGHDFKEEVVRHEYFGSSKVLIDLENICVNGYVENPSIIRDPITSCIIGMKKQ